MIKKILVPTDFSGVAENAFKHAVSWAISLKAEVHVIHVPNEYNPYAAMGESAPFVGVMPVEAISATTERLKKFVQLGLNQVLVNASEAYVPKVTMSLESGLPENVICHIAEEGQYDLIVMGTRGSKHDVFDKILGTVSHAVMDKLDIPLLFIPPNVSHKQVKKVVYASDLKASQPFRIWQAYQYLQGFQPDFHCVHVQIDGSKHSDLQLHELDSYFRSSHPDMPIQFHLVSMNSVEEGVKFTVDLLNAELLCIYSHHYTLFQHLFARSNSHRLLDFMAIPMLLLKAGDNE